MNLTTVQLKGVSSALAEHSDGEAGGIKVHFRMDESGLLHLDTVGRLQLPLNLVTLIIIHYH